MSRLNFNQDDIECILVVYSSPKPDGVCVQFAEHNCFPIEKLRRQDEQVELAKRIIRRGTDGVWQACITVENGLLPSGSRHYIPSKMRNIIIQRAHDTHAGVETTKNMLTGRKKS